MVESTNNAVDPTRMVYNFKRIITVDDVRTTAIDAHDPIVLLGNYKGYVWPWIKDNSNKNNVSVTHANRPDQENLIDHI